MVILLQAVRFLLVIATVALALFVILDLSGYPLTGLMHWYVGRYGILSSADDIWAIPAMNLLFLLQWCIWGMLIGVIVTVFCGGKHNVKSDSRD